MNATMRFLWSLRTRDKTSGFRVYRGAVLRGLVLPERQLRVPAGAAHRRDAGRATRSSRCRSASRCASTASRRCTSSRRAGATRAPALALGRLEPVRSRGPRGGRRAARGLHVPCAPLSRGRGLASWRECARSASLEGHTPVFYVRGQDRGPRELRPRRRLLGASARRAPRSRSSRSSRAPRCFSRSSSSPAASSGGRPRASRSSSSRFPRRPFSLDVHAELLPGDGPPRPLGAVARRGVRASAPARRRCLLSSVRSPDSHSGTRSQTLACILPGALLLLRTPRGRAGAARASALAAVGFALGAAPWIAYNTVHPLASIRSPFATPVASPGGLVSNLERFTLVQLPELVATGDPEAGGTPLEGWRGAAAAALVALNLVAVLAAFRRPQEALRRGRTIARGLSPLALSGALASVFFVALGRRPDAGTGDALPSLRAADARRLRRASPRTALVAVVPARARRRPRRRALRPVVLRAPARAVAPSSPRGGRRPPTPGSSPSWTRTASARSSGATGPSIRSTSCPTSAWSASRRPDGATGTGTGTGSPWGSPRGRSRPRRPRAWRASPSAPAPTDGRSRPRRGRGSSCRTSRLPRASLSRA